MKAFLPLALTLAPFSPLAAQITVKATAATPIGWLATDPTMPSLFANVPQGEDITNTGFGLAPTVPLPRFNAFTAGQGSNSARISISVLGIVTSTLAANKVGTTSSPTAAGATNGPIEVLLEFRGAPGATGTLEIQYILNTNSPLITTNESSIDIDDDGTIEVSAPGASSFPVTMGASGTTLVRIRSEFQTTFGGATVVGTNTINATWTLDPIANCTVTPYGFGCLGATSAATELTAGAQRALVFTGNGAFPQSPVLSVFGTQMTMTPLGAGCLLLNDATSVYWLAADNAGFVSQTLPIPATAFGSALQQFIAVDPATLDLRASGGHEIVCTP